MSAVAPVAVNRRPAVAERAGPAAPVVEPALTSPRSFRSGAFLLLMVAVQFSWFALLAYLLVQLGT